MAKKDRPFSYNLVDGNKEVYFIPTGFTEEDEIRLEKVIRDFMRGAKSEIVQPRKSPVLDFL